MTNLIENLHNVKESDIIFIETQDGTGRVFVALESWFETMNSWETYNQYGITNHECPDEVCECADPVRAYNYHDGSNWQSVVIEADNFDTDYSIIADENEIETYTDALKNAKRTNSNDAVKEYSFSNDDTDLVIVDSAYQSHWALYTIADESNAAQI